MKIRTDINSGDLDRTLAGMPAQFTLEQFLRRLGGGTSAAMRQRAERWLESEEEWFRDAAGVYRRRTDFFTGREFAVTPDDWEIASGVLLPGHRFAPFVSPEIFPSEVELFQKSGTATPRRELTAPLGQVFRYHTLLGSEQVFDYLIAESPANAGLRNSVRPGDPVTLTVFELADFYAEHDFKVGDALICRVADYRTGRVEFEFRGGDRRSTAARREYVEALDDAVERVCAAGGDYLEIPEQLVRAFLTGDDRLFQPDASLDEYVTTSLRIEIRTDGDHAVLAPRGAETAGDTPALPEEVRISGGTTDDIGVLLREIGSALTPTEVESYILDQCYARDPDFDSFFNRAFSRGELHYTDAAQQAVFQNYLEERFEELSANYNRADDEPKAPLRAQILELLSDRLDWFDQLAGRAAPPGEDEQHLIHHLAQIAMQLNEILRILNDPGFTPGPDELNRLADQVDRRAGEQDGYIDQLQEIWEGKP